MTTCRCGRLCCSEHLVGGHCIVCALGYGMFDNLEVEPVSDLIKLSLSHASGDLYIVTPGRLQNAQPLPLEGVERLVSAAINMLQAPDIQVRRRASTVLANTLSSWPTLNPSQVSKNEYSISLLSCAPVRQWLMYVLKHSRATAAEPVANVILDGLKIADFRELYPGIAGNLTMLRCASLGTCVHEVFQTVAEFYPTHRYALNEKCELLLYGHYVSKQGGVGSMMQRLYGPKLSNAPILAKALKRGVQQSDYDRFIEWYPGEADVF